MTYRELRKRGKVVGACLEWQGGLTTKGYGSMCYHGKPAFVHRVSALLNGFDITGKCVCHSCDNRRCFNPKHLFVSDYAGNNKDRARKNRSAVGEAAGSSKLSEAQVEHLLRQYRPGLGVKLAKRFGVSSQCVYDIVNGVQWKHVKGRRSLSSLAVGSANNKSKTCASEVKIIRRRRKEGATLTVLASDFGLTIGTIHQITTRKTWKHVK